METLLKDGDHDRLTAHSASLDRAVTSKAYTETLMKDGGSLRQLISGFHRHG